MEITAGEGLIIIKLKSGLELEIYPENGSLSINTDKKSWDIGHHEGELIADGFRVNELINKFYVNK